MSTHRIAKLQRLICFLSLLLLTACSPTVERDQSKSLTQEKKEEKATIIQTTDTIIGEKEILEEKEVSENIGNGLQMIKENNLIMAEEYFRKELQKNPNSEEAHTYLEQMEYYEMGLEAFVYYEDEEGAREYLEQVIFMENGAKEIGELAQQYLNEIDRILIGILPHVIDQEITISDLKDRSNNNALFAMWRNEIEEQVGVNIEELTNKSIMEIFTSQYEAQPLSFYEKQLENRQKFLGYWVLESSYGTLPPDFYFIFAISENNFRWTSSIGYAHAFSITSKRWDTNNGLEINLQSFSTGTPKKAFIHLEYPDGEGRDRIIIDTNSYVTGSTINEDGNLENINEYVAYTFKRITEDEYFNTFGERDLDQYFQVQYDLDSFW